MKLIIRKDHLEIIPEDEGYPNYDERDTAYVENVLGLKHAGDSVLLVRRNASNLSCISHLETEKHEDDED